MLCYVMLWCIMNTFTHCIRPLPPHLSQFVFFSAKIFSSAWTNIFPQFHVKAAKSFQFMHRMTSTSKYRNSNVQLAGNKCIYRISNRIAPKMKRFEITTSKANVKQMQANEMVCWLLKRVSGFGVLFLLLLLYFE